MIKTNGTFSQDSITDRLTDLRNGKEIYRGEWLTYKPMSEIKSLSDDQIAKREPIDSDTRKALADFDKFISQPEPVHASETITLNRKGICPKCHTYCDGDCEDN